MGMTVQQILALPEIAGDVNKALAYATAQADKAQQEARAAKLGMAGKLTLKVGEKGGVSVYGLGRFPVTLYREQWARLFENIGTVKAFIEAHATELKAKGDAPKATGTDGK